MARSTSTYGRTPRPILTATLASNGLCPTHRTPILSDGDCWDCGSAPLMATPAANSSGPEAERMATARQFAYLKALFAERTGNASAMTLRDGLLAAHRNYALTFRVASAAITMLTEDPNFARPAAAAAPAAAPQAEVADGYYAIASTGTNDLAFYRLTSSEKWGQSVQLIVGGHPEMFVRRAAIKGILARILADRYDRPEQTWTHKGETHTVPAGSFEGAEGAALRYADEYTTCSRCNRQLTDLTSRLNGIGPVCINAED